jgi:catalase
VPEAGSEFAAEVVDALNVLTGAHAGRRAAHAKGTLCAGTFTASEDAAALTRAEHMQSAPVRTHVRFSNGSGDPDAPDYGREGRGIAVKFYLPDGTTTDIVAVTLPVFLVRTPEDFLELSRARAPDPDTGEPDMEKIGAFLGAHPETVPPIQYVLGTEPAASYLQCAYNALHAFRFVNDGGEQCFVRYHWEPELGEATIPDAEAKELGPDYLQEDLAERLSGGPAGFVLSVQIADGDDPIDDPTAAWPEARERVTLGRLEISGLAFDREQDGDVLVFDPTRVTDGIECSDDPILSFRSHAYAESVYRRSGVRREQPV